MLLILLLSLLTICFQLLITKVMAFVLWNHIVYLIISVALLGYGISSTGLSLWRDRVSRAREEVFVSLNLLLFALSIILGLFALKHLQLGPTQLVAREGGSLMRVALPLLGAYLIFLLPFLFSGNVVVWLFYRHPEQTSRLYMADLVGAAGGCLLFILMIGRIGAVGGILLCTFVALVGAALLLVDLRRPAARALFAFGLLCAVGVVVLFLQREQIFRFEVDQKKCLAVALDKQKNPTAKVEHSAWDVVTRVDVVGAARSVDIDWTDFGPDTRMISFDGDAISHMKRRSAAFPTEEDIRRFEREDVRRLLLRGAVGGEHLVIGLGGGPDLATALLLRARSVTGVDVNGALLRAMKTRYAEFTGQLFNRPQIRIVHSEGRSFLRRAKRRFDLIYMSGVDTFSALSTGAYVLAENYLYTVEAIDEYFSALKPDGILYILRWFFEGSPRESLRLFATILEALRRRGIRDPARHVLVYRPTSGNFRPGITIVRRKPLTAAECREIAEATRSKFRNTKLVHLPAPVATWADRRLEEAKVYGLFAQLFDKKQEPAFYDQYDFDVSPVDDDRPFFFKYYKLSTMLSGTWAAVAGTGPIHGYWSYLVFIVVLLVACAATAIFVWAPLWALRRGRIRTVKSGLGAVYFSCLGLGFIMLEVALMQKFALFLGHPMYSLSVILGGMLLFSGIGSGLSKRWISRPRRGIRIALACTFGMVFFYVLLGAAVTHALLGLPLSARIIIALLLMAPLAIALGVFFPLGLTVLERADAAFIPWAWGINAGFTVIGSIIAIIIAMAIGFNSVLLLSSAVYGLGTLSFSGYIGAAGETAEEKAGA